MGGEARGEEVGIKGDSWRLQGSDAWTENWTGDEDI